MVESDAKAFAFRMPPEVKAAAVALTKTDFQEWKEDGSRAIRNVDPSSINEALIYLTRTGAGRAAGLIEHDLNDSRRAVDTWKEIVKHFLNHSDVEHILAEDFPVGSNIRTSIRVKDDTNSETGATAGVSRQYAFDELAWAQKILTTRTEAKAALLKAAKG